MPFKVVDNETGKTITFQNKPSESDLQEAFGAARGTKSTVQESASKIFPQNHGYEDQWGPTTSTKAPISNNPSDYFPTSTGITSEKDIQTPTVSEPDSNIPAGYKELSPLETMMANRGSQEDTIRQGLIAGIPEQAVSKGLEGMINAGKGVARVVGKGWESQPAKLTGLKPSVDARSLETLMENPNLNPTSGALTEAVQAKKGQIWPQVQEQVAQARPINTKTAIQDPAFAAYENIQGKAPGSPSAKAADAYYMETGNYPKTLTGEEAQAIKQHLGQSVKNWERSEVKDAATSGRTSGERAAYKQLKDEIANAVPDPELYKKVNEEYGGLSGLFSKSESSGARQPSQVADDAIKLMPQLALKAEWPPIAGALKEKAVWPLTKAQYNLSKYAEEPTVAPQTLAELIMATKAHPAKEKQR